MEISSDNPEVIIKPATSGARFAKPQISDKWSGWTVWGNRRAGDWIHFKDAGKYDVSVTAIFSADGMGGRDIIDGKPAETAKIALVVGNERIELDIPREFKTTTFTVDIPAGILPVYTTGVWGTYFLQEIRIKKN